MNKFLLLLACLLTASCSKGPLKADHETADTLIEKSEVRENSDDNDIKAVVEQWNQSLNLRDAQMSAEVYAPYVNFYSQNLSAQKCVDMRINLAKADPTWHQEIISDIYLNRQDDESVLANFTKQSNSKKGIHTYPAYLILKKYDNGWKVVTESDKLTDKNLAKPHKRTSRKVPDDAIRGDFDGDGKIDRVWIEAKYDSDGYAIGTSHLRSDNPALEGLTWESPRGVFIMNVGDLNNSNRDFLGAVPICDSTWRMFETYGYKNGKWAEALSPFSVWTGDDDYHRIWKSSRKGYVVISYNDMSDLEQGFESRTEEVKLNF